MVARRRCRCDSLDLLDHGGLDARFQVFGNLEVLTDVDTHHPYMPARGDRVVVSSVDCSDSAAAHSKEDDVDPVLVCVHGDLVCALRILGTAEIGNHRHVFDGLPSWPL